MPDNLHHTEPILNGNPRLPLESFFLSLKQHGFKVTPAQIADSHAVIARYAGEVENVASLSYYLSPLFANNEEEQLQFREIYEQHFVEVEAPDSAEAGDAERWRTHLNKHWWKYLAALAAIIGIVLFTWNRQPAVDRLPLQLRSSLEGKGRIVGNHFTPFTNEDFSVIVSRADSNPRRRQDINFVTSFDWGDQSGPDSSGLHRYVAEGIYTLQAVVEIREAGKYLYTDTLRQAVLVCAERNELQLLRSVGSDSVQINQQLRVTATVTGSQPDHFEWFQNGQLIKRGSFIDTAFEQAGERQFICYAVFDSLGGACTLSQVVHLTVYDPAKSLINASFGAAPDASTIVLSRRVKPWLFLLTGLCFLISFPAMLWFNRLRKRPLRDKQKQQVEVTHLYNDLVSKFSGKRPPFDLPFRTRNTVLQPEPALSEVAWQMRRRIDDEATYLHLGKTINKAVRNAGFFQPVTVPRTHQSEYLVLIDETIVNNQQVKLFEYVVELLRKQNVFIDKFYYRQDPMKCYNSLDPAGVTLEKLFEKYPRHILLVFGTGEQFIYPHYPVFDPTFQQLIRRWKFKAVITPAPVKDWGLKEKVVLSSELMVVPADVYGQLLMMEHIFSGRPVSQADLHEFGDQFYKAASFDVEDIEGLMSYCDQAEWAVARSGKSEDNILFQWIAALALYPRIRWELTIGIGKTILENHRIPGELNFTNLLRIARIQWMKDGRFPDFTRLELLKRLTIHHEVLGRETILAMLDEIPAHEITGDNFVYEEKEIQRVINEFNLYVYDPAKYGRYSVSASLFEKLWQEKKILDGPAKVYLKNEDRSWATMLQTRAASAEGNEKISFEDYLQTPATKEERLKGFRLWLGFTIAVVFLASFISLIALTILHFSGANWFKGLTEQKTGFRDVQFSFRDSTGLKSKPIALLQLDTAAVLLSTDTVFTMPILFNDSAKAIMISLDDNLLFNSTLRIDKNKYQVALSLPVSAPNATTSISARLMLPQSCAAGIYDYQRNVAAADPTIIISDSLVNITVQTGGQCLNEIAAGKNVSSAILASIIENFKASGTNLAVSTQSLYPLRDDELIIYYRPATAVPQPKNITVAIILSDESLRTSGSGFKRALEANGFTVSSLTVSRFSNNSQITYYSESVPAKTLMLINQVYSRYYPQLKIPTKLDNNSRLSGNEQMIQIFIKKFQSTPAIVPTKDNSVQPQRTEKQDAPLSNNPAPQNATPEQNLPKQQPVSKDPVTYADLKDGPALSKQGIAEYNNKNYDQATTSLRAAITLNENDATSWYYLGMSLNAKYQYDEAIQAFTKALNSKDKNFTGSLQGRAYLNRGLAKMQLKGENTACEDFRMAAKMGEKAAEQYVKNCY